MPRRFTEEEKVDIRARLVDIGRKLFVRFGVDKTTIADIAVEAEVGKGTFYAFFTSKGDLFMEIYSQDWNSAYKALEERYLDRDGDLATLVQDYMRDNRKMILSHPILSVVYDRSTLSMISDKAVVNRVREFKALNAPRVMSIIDSWFRKKGITCHTDTEVIAGMMRSLSFLNYHKDEIGENVFDEVIAAFVRGIAHEVQSSAHPQQPDARQQKP